MSILYANNHGRSLRASPDLLLDSEFWWNYIPAKGKGKAESNQNEH